MARRVDLRSLLGNARSQGPLRSTCLAFAVSAAHEVALFEDEDVVDLCEELLYWAAKQHDAPGPGTTFPAARDGLIGYGQPLEDEWPYDDLRDDEDPGYAPPPKALIAVPRWTTSLSPITATPEGIRAELDLDQAVALGMPTWPALDHPQAGRLDIPRPEDLDGAYHAVTVVGYDDRTSELLIRNSWGQTWVDGGCAWLPFRFLDVHACEAWVLDAAAHAGTPPSAASRTTARYGSEGS